MVFEQYITRKGAPTHEVNLGLQRQVFSGLSDVDQRLIALNVVGGFQTNVVKKKWDDDVEAQCSFCDDLDSRGHRLLHCPATCHIREIHAEAIQTLSSRSEWQYLPITTHHEDRYVLETICKSLKLPNGEWCGPDGSHHVYYTDGSCKHPAVHEARLSAWSVIRDDEKLFGTRATVSSSEMCGYGFDTGCPEYFSC